MSVLLSIRNLVKHYPASGGRRLIALDDISFDLRVGEILGVVGESGCGKSTLARTIMRLDRPTSGQIIYAGTDLAGLSRRALKAARRDIQMVFQDPFGSLNPRHTVGTIIGEPLIVHNIPDRQARIFELLDMVGLPRSAVTRLPHQFSGGQRQRIAIARALAIRPKIIVADESVSALDVSIQSQIINLLSDLRRDLGLSIIFISHDLSVVRHVSDNIGVMYFGRLAEYGPSEAIFEAPRHPYTRALLSAIPRIPGRDFAAAAGKRIILAGDVPDISNRPAGCLFHPRCNQRQDRCLTDLPRLRQVEGDGIEGRFCACHFAAGLLEPAED